jgi:hypothetical protein
MGSPKTPTPLDRYIPVDFATLQLAADLGQFTIVFETDSQACNTKYRLLRLTLSLAAYAPNDPLTKACKSFVFKWRKGTRILTISDRLRSQEASSMDKALKADPDNVDVISSDPMEMPTIDYEALEKQYQENRNDDDEAS